MSATKRILITLTVIILTVILEYISIEAASTYSGLSVDGRRNALTGCFIILLVGFLAVIAIWLPWKKWLNRE